MTRMAALLLIAPIDDQAHIHARLWNRRHLLQGAQSITDNVLPGSDLHGQGMTVRFGHEINRAGGGREQVKTGMKCPMGHGFHRFADDETLGKLPTIRMICEVRSAGATDEMFGQSTIGEIPFMVFIHAFADIREPGRNGAAILLATSTPHQVFAVVSLIPVSAPNLA
jgi:hypothetical protein